MKNKKVKTVCNDCGKVFILKPFMVIEQKLDSSTTKIFFKCPKCKKEYLVGYKNREIINNNQKINEILEEIKGKYKFEPEELNTLVNKIERLRVRNNEINGILKAIYGRG